MDERPPTAQPGALARVTPVSARGGAMVWLMGLTLVLGIGLILGLIGLIAWQGAVTFWPKPIDQLRLTDGSTVLGIAVATESYDPPPDPSSVSAPDAAKPTRTLYRVGNRDLNQEPFRWIPESEIAERTRPADAVLIERTGEWGIWLGIPEGIVLDRPLPEDRAQPEDAEARWAVQTPYGPGSAQLWRPMRIDGTRGDPVERVTVPLTGDDFWAALAPLHTQAVDRRTRIHEIDTTQRSGVNTAIHDWTVRLKAGELALARRDDSGGLPWVAWLGLVVVAVGSLVGAVVLARRAAQPMGHLPRAAAGLVRVLVVVAALAGLACVLERPHTPGMTPEQFDQLQAEHDRAIAELQARGEAIDAQIQAIRDEDATFHLLVRDPRTGSLASVSTLMPDEPMLVSQVVRAVATNRLGGAQRLGVYLSRWGEFLSARPRNANTEGGVFPVIVGTVTLTMLLTIVVVPLGVVAAIYLREYARQGPMTSVIRIAVNNLAGVPSIVYGVFGLGFFSYTVGRYIDGGPADAMPRSGWWMMAGGLGLVVLAAMLLGLVGRDASRTGPVLVRRRVARVAVGVLWLVALGLVVSMVVGTPYFHGWFNAKRALGSPTFGTGGMLWAAMTLALLTLPVVIVATEEAISAVPRTLREGSIGCGASRWQTIRRVVLPGALPGIMTGAILAVARGAGEVAPLMLVGAVKLADDLPVGPRFPFVHAEASFMHLGFHIYDLGFQSPDSQAARPLVWTTTLLLISIVLVLNLAAIVLRSRLRARTKAVV